MLIRCPETNYAWRVLIRWGRCVYCGKPLKTHPRHRGPVIVHPDML